MLCLLDFLLKISASLGLSQELLKRIISDGKWVEVVINYGIRIQLWIWIQYWIWRNRNILQERIVLSSFLFEWTAIFRT